jgi:hypothetical protein
MYPATKMPLRPAWNTIEPSVYLTLFGWLAPIKEGRAILQKFSDLVDPKFAHPTYLAYVVLTPVKKIVEHLVDICFLERILTDCNKTIRVNKLRHLATAYVARQYLEVLVWASRNTLERPEDEELSGERIGQMDGVTKIVLNLPREYQWWNKYYTKEGKSITPDSDDESELQEHERPFDVTQAIDPSFRQCVFPKNNPKKYKGMTLPSLTLSESWDPLIITQRLMSKQYDISLKDMNKEPIESYKNGVRLKNRARGNTAGGETTKTTEDADNEVFPKANKRQKTTNGRRHNSKAAKLGEDETDEHDGENNETSDQEDENITETADSQPTNSNKSPDETAEILKDIICKNLKEHMQTDTRCTPEVIMLANELTQDLAEYITNQRPTECSIAMEDIEDRQPQTSTRVRK